ncbi:hypothetical protein [Achromobacter marplatensis]|uniref:hypothetical protein n=1 Tax=Achromobacter marplatensis TaxID=470868 RepID=UPI0028E1EEAF|nr:hypothetical protein [Achromobacter marplatensis]
MYRDFQYNGSMSKDQELLKAVRSAAKAAEPLRVSLLELGHTLLRRQKEVEERKTRVEEDMKRGSRLTKHRFSL